MIQTIMQINPNNMNAPSIFNFTTFISALALLAILYTLSTVRYHFRIAITPFSMFKISFFAIAFIGICTLITDLWFAEEWPILHDQSLIQAMLGGLFLILVLTWIFFTFISPLKFNRYNCKKFTTTLYIILNKGSDNELPVIADELGRSVDGIIKSCSNSHEIRDNKLENLTDKHYAHDLVMMIGHRKFCRHMISSAPGTAVEIFRSISHYKKYDIPIGHFAVNVSTEALINSDSPIYHEDDNIRSGFFGHIKPFSKAVYGDYKLIEALGHLSPLDINYELSSNFTADQLQAYCRCTLITIENYLETSKYYNPCYAINRAINRIKDSSRSITYINESMANQNDKEINRRLHITTSFPSKVAILLDKHWSQSVLRKYNKYQHTIYDTLASYMFDIIFYATHVSSPPDLCWFIQYISVWEPLFNDYGNSKSMKIIYFKLRRLMYDSIIEMNRWPNYKSARILGICLNIMGLTPRKETTSNNYYALHLTIIGWATKNFQNLYINYPDIAKTVLQGSLGYDADKNQLTKSYAVGMKKETEMVTLQLENVSK